MSTRNPPLPPELESALAVQWMRPPAAARRRARKLPAETAVPAPGPAAARRRMRPRDIRSLTAEFAAPQVANHAFDAADVTLRWVRTQAEGLWRVDGRVWLADDLEGGATDAPVLEVALVQDEHVLARCAVPDGGTFRFVEALRGRWTLELHLPDGRCLVIEGECA